MMPSTPPLLLMVYLQNTIESNMFTSKQSVTLRLCVLNGEIRWKCKGVNITVVCESYAH